MLLNKQAALYGDVAIAAMSIVGRCCMTIFSIGIGIGQGFQPVAGFNYGAGKYSRVKKSCKITFVISLRPSQSCLSVVSLHRITSSIISVMKKG